MLSHSNQPAFRQMAARASITTGSSLPPALSPPTAMSSSCWGMRDALGMDYLEAFKEVHDSQAVRAPVHDVPCLYQSLLAPRPGIAAIDQACRDGWTACQLCCSPFSRDL